MAIYHLSTKPVSRAKGRSSTAAAAYRSADRVHDLTTDQVFDYSRKRGVEHTEIVLPTEAAKSDINWARDRQALWNAAEVAEKRKDARVAREYEVALPHELTKAQRVELVRQFSSELANRYGVVVDLAIHAPHRAGDERNFHAHILATTREITPTGLGAKASIEWSDTDRAKKGLVPSKVEVKAIRERWAELTNEHLREHGIEVRVDHRSLEAQGIDRTPTSHLGPAVSAMERRGIETEVSKRISLEMANERLARAAELGRIEREGKENQRSILDLSGDLKAAQESVHEQFRPELARATIEAGKAQARAKFEQHKMERTQQREVALQQERAQAERVKLGQEFNQVITRRAERAYGWGDQGLQWKACSSALKELVEGITPLSPQGREKTIERMLETPKMAEALRDQLKLRQERVKALDRDYGLEL